MKNIHILPTDNPSRLRIGNNGNFVLGLVQSATASKNDDFTNQHIYITSDEEIKEGDYFWKPDCNMIFRAEYTPHKGCQKVILTTDQDLIKDGVQAIDDEFLEWFVKNPSCEEVEVKKFNGFAEDFLIIIPIEESKQIKCYCGHTIMCDCSPLDEPKQETLEEAAEKIYPHHKGLTTTASNKIMLRRCAWIKGAKWQQERSYSEEEVRNLFRNYQYDSAQFAAIMEGDTDGKPTPTGWFEKFKKK